MASAQPAAILRWVEQAAQAHGIEASLLRAIVMVESRGNPRAVSPENARGLCQILPTTAQEYDPDVTPDDLFDPRVNLDLAARHLAELCRKVRAAFPSTSLMEHIGLVAAAYNAGWGRVIAHGGLPSTRETQIHTRRVLRLYEQYRQAGTSMADTHTPPLPCAPDSARGEDAMTPKTTMAPHDQKQRVEAFFDQSEGWQGKIYCEPEDWFARAVVRRRFYSFQMLNLIPHVRHGTVLDIGCGSGVYLEELSKRGFKPFGMDYSIEMLRVCQERQDAAGRFFLSRADIEAMPFKNDAFDLVMCVGVLGYLLSDRHALTEMHRVLKPGQYLLVNVTNMYSLSNLDTLVRMKLRPRAFPPQVEAVQTDCAQPSMWILEHSPTRYCYKWYHLGKFERMMNDMGFRLVRARTFGYQFRILRKLGFVPERALYWLERLMESLFYKIRIPYLSYSGETYTGLFQAVKLSAMGWDTK